MANPDFRDFDNELGNKGKSFKRSKPAKSAAFKMGTASWPGLPGKSQPRNRSAGIKKLTIHPKAEGL